MRISFGFLPMPGTTAQLSARIEAYGFTGLTIADSPLLAGELHGQMMIAAGSTTHVEIVAGVTNSVTRDASITASALASLQVESGGRAVCGIGRGDSAVRKIGGRPDDLASFERYVSLLRRYLAGEEVTRSGGTSRIEWISDDPLRVPTVPIEIAPSGPAMLAIAGRQANRIALGVGAAPEYVADYVRRAKAAVEVAGRDPESVAYGAYVPIVVNDDPVVARREVRRIASAFAHFSTMKGQGRIGMDDRRPEALFREAKAVGSLLSYDGDPYRESTQDGALGSMSDEFIDWFTAAGTPERVIGRLRELAEAGVSYVHVLSGHHALPPDVRDRNLELLGSVVRPALQAELPAQQHQKTE